MLNRMRKFTEEREQGFTLIELLVVIIIIGILAAIAIPVFLNQRKKGVDAGLKSDLKSAATAAETIATDKPSDANYGADAAAIKAALVAAGFNKASNGNTVAIKGGPAGGFCIQARNDGGSTAAAEFFWYVSDLGGLQPTKASAAPAGACGGVLTGFSTIS